MSVNFRSYAFAQRCASLSALFCTRVTPEKEQTNGDPAGYDDNINPRPTSRRFFRQFVRKLGSLQSFRRELKCPRNYQRDRKSEDKEQNDEPHCPVGNLEEGKNLARDLHEQPRNHPIGDRNFVNVAPLQLGEKIARIHIVSVFAQRVCRRQKLKNGIPSKMTASPIEERTGRTNHRFTEMAAAAAPKASGVHGYPQAR